MLRILTICGQSDHREGGKARREGSGYTQHRRHCCLIVRFGSIFVESKWLIWGKHTKNCTQNLHHFSLSLWSNPDDIRPNAYFSRYQLITAWYIARRYQIDWSTYLWRPNWFQAICPGFLHLHHFRLLEFSRKFIIFIVDNKSRNWHR